MRLDDNRLFHMRGVAELMQERDLENGGTAEHAEDMFLLGLVHDCGYALTEDRYVHERAGGTALARADYKYAREVANHGNPAPMPEEDTYELRLLQWCDMSVDSRGERVSVAERLEDIGKRHGTDSQAYIVSAEMAERLFVLGYE